MKKLVFVALTMLLLLMTVSFSAHAEDDIQLCYTLTSDISAALSISGGTASRSVLGLVDGIKKSLRKCWHTASS